MSTLMRSQKVEIGRFLAPLSGKFGHEYRPSLNTVICDKRKLRFFFISPSSVEQLQAALKIVNEFKTPIWTISRGKNLG